MKRWPVYAVAAVGLVAVLAGLVMAAAGGDPDPSPTAGGGEAAPDQPVADEQPTARDQDADDAGAQAPSPDGSGDQPAGDFGEGDEPPMSSEQLWADMADPATSDLPGDVFRAAADTAAAVVVADTTGQGRGRWPDYWSGPRASPCCAEVTIHAAGARRHPDHPGEVLAMVAWSGEALDHVPGAFTEQSTEVRLAPDGQGGWRPRR